MVVSYLVEESWKRQLELHGHIILYIARNVVFYCLLVKSNNAKKYCQLLISFVVALKGLVCKLAVEHQIRYTKPVDLPTVVAVQVVSLVICI